MKRLIVNADDFGLTRGINRAIVEAHQRGVVTSATLMANGPEFENAVSQARSTPGLGIGCHLDLIQLTPILPAAQIPSLVNDGRFRRGWARFAASALGGRMAPEQLSAEAAAQMRRIQAAGVTLTHFDSHQHTHLFPAVLKPLLRAARECGVSAVRNPFETAPLGNALGLLGHPKLMARYGVVTALRAMAGEFRRLVRQAGLATTDGTVGIVFTGFWDRERLTKLLRRLPEGTWELVTHPGYAGPELAPLSGLVESRQNEFDLLTAADIKRCIEESGIELISYRELVV